MGLFLSLISHVEMGGIILLADFLLSRWNYYEISWTTEQNGNEECSRATWTSFRLGLTITPEQTFDRWAPKISKIDQ